MSKLQTVIDRKDGFNQVSAWLAPNGELVISLSHRATDDEEVLVRIRSENDVILTDAPGQNWEDPETDIGRLNAGGNWESA